MRQILRITNYALQDHQLILDDGSVVSIELYFRPNQQGWFFNYIRYLDTFEVNGLRITSNPNMLQQWRNLIPFGIGCFSVENREPMLQNDFLSEASKLYILNEDDVEEYTEFLTGG